MTALNAEILFNSTSGSDTQSSGSSAGANVYGSGASTTSASSVVTGITTTGVQAGDLLWVQSSSGRQFSVIASVDSGTQVTCDDTFANTESSRTWAIGGKRATFDNADSRKVFDDLHGGWVIESETDQTITSPIAPNGTGDIDNFAVIDLGGNTVTYTSSSHYPFTVQENCLLKNGTFTKTTGTPRGILVNGIANYSYGVCHDIVTDGFDWGFFVSANRSGYLSECTAKNGSIGFTAYNTVLFCNKCFSENNTGDGFSTNHTLKIYNCVSSSNNIGFYSNGSTRIHTVVNSIAHGNTSHGLDINGLIESCNANIFASNGGYGINSAAAKFVFANSNAFYNNTSGNVSNQSFDLGTDITLTADPFVDPTASPPDFNISDSAGGGATLRSTNYTLGG